MIIVAGPVTTNSGTTVPAVTVTPTSWKKGEEKYQQTHNINDFLDTVTTTDGKTLNQALKDYDWSIEAGGGAWNKNVAATFQALEEMIEAALNNPQKIIEAQNGTPLNLRQSPIGENNDSTPHSNTLLWFIALLVIGGLLFLSNPPTWK